MRYVLILALIATLTLSAILPVPVVRAGTTPVDVYLYGPGGAGGTTTVATVNSSGSTLGTTSAEFWPAQTFQVVSGTLSQFTIKFGPNTGSPTGTVSWEIDSDNVSIPGTILVSGTFTPTPNATNTITVVGGPFLSANTTYWLVLKPTTTQATNTFWTLRDDLTNPYASGQKVDSSQAGTTWIVRTSEDLSITVTTVAGAAPANQINYNLAQSFNVGSNVSVSTIGLYLKKSGSPTGTLTLRVELDSGNIPSGVLAFSQGSATYSESSLSTSYGYANFTFSPALVITTGNTYWLNLSTSRVDATNYIAWGADSYCNLNNMLHYTTFWGAEVETALFTLNPYVPTATPTFTPTRTPTPTATFTPSPTFTPTPDQYIVGTLSSGQAYKIDYSITAGDVANNVLLVVIVGLLLFCIVVWLIRR
jgi:hypothetical protein